MTSESNGREWFDDYSDDEEEIGAIDYDLSITPNDFNVLTLFSFIDSGAIVIPGFQRHYVWDITRASKLIESLILGLPVPQLFLYEEDRNRFLVIDGQQRLMSIYYFIKERFPRKESRPKLRKVFRGRRISSGIHPPRRRIFHRFPALASKGCSPSKKPICRIKLLYLGEITNVNLTFDQYETSSLGRILQRTTMRRSTRYSAG